MVNYLITGITGFFGRNFTKYLLNNSSECKIIGTAHSECKLAYFKKNFPDIKTYVIDLASDKMDYEFDTIIMTHKIDYIIHAAAMKHVEICQENPSMAYRVNVAASDSIIRAAKRNNIKNIIALSTDKTNNPCTTYGIVKYIMQENILANGYSIFQGANFFGSDGSVLDIWFQQYIRGKPLSVRSGSYIRYFNPINHVCERVYKNLDNKGIIISPDYVYVVKLEDLLLAFQKYFKYDKVCYIHQLSYEKEIEILRDEVTNRIDLSVDDIIPLVDDFYKSML